MFVVSVRTLSHPYKPSRPMGCVWDLAKEVNFFSSLDAVPHTGAKCTATSVLFHVKKFNDGLQRIWIRQVRLQKKSERHATKFYRRELLDRGKIWVFGHSVLLLPCRNVAAHCNSRRGCWEAVRAEMGQRRRSRTDKRLREEVAEGRNASAKSLFSEKVA